MKMNLQTKLMFALEHVAHLHDLIEGNEYEHYLNDHVTSLECEFKRQLSLEEGRLNDTSRRKNRNGESQNKGTGTSY